MKKQYLIKLKFHIATLLIILQRSSEQSIISLGTYLIIDLYEPANNIVKITSWLVGCKKESRSINISLNTFNRMIFYEFKILL